MTLPQAVPGHRAGRDLGVGESVPNVAAVDYFTGGRLPETQGA
jgi:hypothetical protein